jgi:hypothetical protein
MQKLNYACHMEGKKLKKGSLSHEIVMLQKFDKNATFNICTIGKMKISKTKMTNDEDACTHDSTWWTIEGVYEMFGV